MLIYSRSSSKIRSAVGREQLFRDFLAQTSGPCLQISVKGEIGRKFGDNWISVDRYDHSAVIDRHDDIHALGFPDGHFNSVVCWSVLEHVPDPQLAIAEMRRVLKPGGSIWIQVPFLFPYHADPYDYWRVTSSGTAPMDAPVSRKSLAEPTIGRARRSSADRSSGAKSRRSPDSIVQDPGETSAPRAALR